MKPKICPECKGELVDDNEDVYCKKCGLVIEEVISNKDATITGIEPS